MVVFRAYYLASVNEALNVHEVIEGIIVVLLEYGHSSMKFPLCE